MNRINTTREVTELLKETAEAHHEATAATEATEATGGEDPDWAMWYARHLAASLTAALEIELSHAELACILMQAAEEHQARAPERPWAQYYGELIVERFREGPQEHLALYHSAACPYCIRVRRVIDDLGIDIELRDILEDPDHRTALLAARGRATVPVLRCTSKAEDRWMPESRDIVRYLRARFA